MQIYFIQGYNNVHKKHSNKSKCFKHLKTTIYCDTVTTVKKTFPTNVFRVFFEAFYSAYKKLRHNGLP